MKSVKMTRILTGAAACVALGLTPAVQAGFVNGGFETGDLSGWTVQYGDNYGVNILDPLSSVYWGSWDYPSYGTPARVVDKAGFSDGYLSVPSGANMFIGNKMAALNDIEGYYHVTQISQTGVIDASDMTGGATSASLYVNWAGVMDDPSHPQDAEPWFIVTVNVNGSKFFEEIHYANEGGWDLTGNYYGDPVYSKAGQTVVPGLQLGDSVDVMLTIADCAYGGHGAYAYLDGIGTAYVPPPDQVPDGGMTAVLFGIGTLGLATLRRRLA